MNRYLLISLIATIIAIIGFLIAVLAKPKEDVKISLSIDDVEYTIPNGPGTYTFHLGYCPNKIVLVKGDK